MIGWREIEFVATVFNIGANVVMLLYMLHNPNQKVPVNVIYMQMCGNISWIISSVLRGDPYLCTTSSSSLIVQTTTAVIIVKNQNTQQIKFDDSSEELPSLPALPNETPPRTVLRLR